MKDEHDQAIVKQDGDVAFLQSISTWLTDTFYSERLVLLVLVLLNTIGILIQIFWILTIAFVPAAEDTKWMELQIIAAVVHVLWNCIMLMVAAHHYILLSENGGAAESYRVSLYYMYWFQLIVGLY